MSTLPPHPSFSKFDNQICLHPPSPQGEGFPTIYLCYATMLLNNILFCILYFSICLSVNLFWTTRLSRGFPFTKNHPKGGLHHTAKKLLVQTERCECVYKRAALANDAFLRKGGTVEQAYDFLLKIITSETCSDAASLRGFSLRYFFKITAPSPFFPSGKNAYAKVRISF